MKIEHDEINKVVNIKFTNGNNLSVTEEFLMMLKMVDIHHSPEISSADQDWNDIWKNIVCNEDGSIDIEIVKAILSNYRQMASDVSKVYCQVTDGNVIDFNTDAKIVLEYFNDLKDKIVTETKNSVLKEIENMLRMRGNGSCL